MRRLHKRGEFLAIEIMKWGVFYPILFAVIAITIAVGLSHYSNRAVESDALEFILAKNAFMSTLVDDGEVIDGGIEKFSTYFEPDFAIKVQLGDEEIYSNKKLYGDKPLCTITNSPFKCSQTFVDYYLHDGKIEKAEIDLVMKRA